MTMMGSVHHWPLVVLAGGGIGMLMGFFGVGGSSVATPVLAILGLPALGAVASPLPATIPAAALAGSSYLRSGDARSRAAARSLLGGVPGTLVGAFVSRWVDGQLLLIASGLVLILVGARIVRPIDAQSSEAGALRRTNRPVLLAATAAVGFLTGLLANGGGFLFVPLYVPVFGLHMRQAVGTSLIVVAVLAMPTLAIHWALGHVDWSVAGLFAAGVLPASAAGTVLSRRVDGSALRQRFGWFLVAFGLIFSAGQLVSLVR